MHTLSRRWVVVATFTLAVACGGGNSADGGADAAARPTCESITERCHPLDPGSGPIHECHEFSEAAATTEAMCMARRTECFATCTASDAGTTDASDAGAGDAAGDAAGGG